MSLFNVSTSVGHRWMGPMSDSPVNLDYDIYKMLYPKLGLRNTWTYSMHAASPDPTREVVPRVSFSISDISYSPNGKTLIAGCADHNVYIFDSHTGRLILTTKQAHSGPVVRTCFIQGTQFVSGSDDSTICLWDMRKITEPVNVLQGHQSYIRSLDYTENTGGMLLSSATDNHIRYWHIPSFQSQRQDQQADNIDTSEFRGVLAICPAIQHVNLSPDGSWLGMVNSQGTLYVIYNLDIIPLSRALQFMHLDEGLVMQLGLFNPNASLKRKNRIRILSGDEYGPSGVGEISKVSGIQFHPTGCLLMMRLSTNFNLGLAHKSSEFSCVVNLQQSAFESDTWISSSSYGSDILEETLMFYRQEKKSGFIEKKHSYSQCGRVVASPGKSSVDLLTFSEDFQLPYDLQKEKSPHSIADLFMGSFNHSGPKQLVEVGNLQLPGHMITCAKFSPCNILLAVGDQDGHLHFYQPVL